MDQISGINHEEELLFITMLESIGKRGSDPDRGGVSHAECHLFPLSEPG